MKPAWQLLVLAATAVLALPCQAQLDVPESAVAKCLVKPDQSLAYPEDAYFANSSGVVTAELEFKDGASEPNVSVTSAKGLRDLEYAVREYVRAYRLPCAPSGTVTRLRQEFHFVPNESRKVSASEMSDPQRERARRTAACWTHVDPGSKPKFPRQKPEQGGTVLLQLTFDLPDQAPKVEVLDPSPYRAYARAASVWAEGYRLPCLDGKPVVATQLVSFRYEGEEGASLKNADLFTFLRGVKDIRKQKKYLDLNQMSCPFELRFSYRQPHMANQILEAGTPVPERKLLIEWLETLQLNVNNAEQNQLLGLSMTITVPCGKIDL